MGELAADWRVRLRSGGAAGEVRGAGVLIDARTVLTCAHVLPDPDAVMWVEFVENPGVEPVPARVADGGWLPDLPDGDGEDVAVLHLDSPRPQARPAVLSTELTAGLAVTVTGYAERFDDGMVLTGTVRGLRGHRVQFDARHRREVVRRGFSGAGAWAVSAEGEPVVVGIVVSWRGDLDEPLPQDNVLAYSYLIPVARMADISPTVREMARPDAWDRGFDRRTRHWLADPSGTPVKVSVVGRGGGRERTLYHLEHLADRVHRPADASRAELIDRLLGGVLAFAPGDYPACREWLLGRGERPAGDSPYAAEPGLTVLVDGVDEARSPARLAGLLARLVACGVRLLLVFRDSGGPGWREVRDLVLEPALFAYVDGLLARGKDWETRRAREDGMVDAESLRHATAAIADLMIRREAIAALAEPAQRLRALREFADELRTAYQGGG
ncbi:serine protease [Streptomyces sp. 378]|uniref:trypsin-like serine peptidase n=1 Tax=Streptomyces sp. 378 TaxID=3049412 RepID=UPI0024C2678B|nr:serine protease [Streptomyces sp. 378]MDK1342580.1 serine protease [Streptomyces sp. 378]